MDWHETGFSFNFAARKYHFGSSRLFCIIVIDYWKRCWFRHTVCFTKVRRTHYNLSTMNEDGRFQWIYIYRNTTYVRKSLIISALLNPYLNRFTKSCLDFYSIKRRKTTSFLVTQVCKCFIVTSYMAPVTSLCGHSSISNIWLTSTLLTLCNFYIHVEKEKRKAKINDGGCDVVL